MKEKKGKKKKEVEKREWGKKKKKRIVTLFLYTRKAQNRRRIHRVVAVYPVTNGTEFRCKFSFYLRCWKIFGKILAISFRRKARVQNAFERYLLLLFAQFFRAVHKCFSNANSHYSFLSRQRCPFKRGHPKREREKDRVLKEQKDTQYPQPGKRKIIAG